jgi:hypothetical protein
LPSRRDIADNRGCPEHLTGDIAPLDDGKFFSSASATNALSTPMTIAIAESGITRRVVVKSPSPCHASSAGVPFNAWIPCRRTRESHGPTPVSPYV